MSFLDTLSEDHKNILVDSISQIALLIAGADGEVDEQETEWAEKITEIRSYAGPEELMPFYKVVGQDFTERFNHLLETLPSNTEQRTEKLVSMLSKVNEVLPQLDQQVAYDLYEGYLSFAKHVAKASGGFLRMWSISGEEAKLMDLKMIKPVEKPVEEDELEDGEIENE